MTDLPQAMTGIVVSEPGGPDVLQAREMPVPAPQDGELLIRVNAAGVNRPDVLQRMGAYPPPPGHSELPGLEVAGEVVATGPNTARFGIGDRVTALVNGGGYAEYCIAAETTALDIPEGLTMIEAAALPETVFTVWHNVFERGALGQGEWLLVHGGSSGIGTTAIQMAKAFGSNVITTAGSPEKCEACTRLGADRVVNYREEDFVAVTKTEIKGANVILDMVGGDYIARNIKAAAPDGHIVQIAFLQGSKVEVDLMPVMLKRLTLTGSTLRARAAEVKAGMGRAIVEKVWPLVGEGKIRPVIDSTFPLRNAAEAHRRMETSTHIGKIVLEV